MAAPVRFSRKREAVYSVISGTKSHPTAEWVFQRVRQSYPDLSLGTVYRNISQLKDDGRLIVVGVVEGKERFDANVTPHVHFICEDCGGVFDIEVPDILSMEAEVQESYGFAVRSHETLFRGLCDKCKEKII